MGKAIGKNRAILILGAIFLFALAACFALYAGQPQEASAVSGTWSVSGITVKGGSRELTGVISNPVKYTDEAVNGELVSTGETLDTAVLKGSSAIIFTAAYPYTTTRRDGDYTEYTVNYTKTKKYEITAINTSKAGDTYIPVGGYVLSVPDSSGWSAHVGDGLTTEGKITFPDKAVESDSGARVAIDSINGVRSKPMVVYYDYESGEKTGTNVYGTEMAAVFDEDSGKFIVDSFRLFGEGDASGSIIPENGFVLSAYGDGYRGIFQGETRFEKGDLLTMVGFDYIRFGGDPITYKYTYDYYDADDPNDACHKNPGRMETESAPFPAYRGDSQTIIYHYGWSYNGSKGTGTNVYGFEAAVNAEGVVVERGVNVSAIPEGGYVISGHAVGRDFIRSNVSLGANITLDKQNKIFSISTSLHSFYVNVKTTVDEIISSAETKMQQLYDLDTASLEGEISAVRSLMEGLESVKSEIERKTSDNTWSDIEKTRAMMNYNKTKLEVEKRAHKILSLSMESKPVTARSVWHRPSEKTPEAISATVNAFADAGINLVFVESFYNGYSLFRSDYVEYHPDFVSCNYGEYPDYLSAFTAAAEEKGIEVHAWVENFYVGLTTEIKLLTDHPDWIMYNDDGSYIQRNEGGPYIFIDPANPEVSDFLIAYYKEMLKKNPLLKGLNLDYIRYPVSDASEDTGYSKASMLEFAGKIGLTKIDPSMSVDKMIKEFRKWAFTPAYNSRAAENVSLWTDYRIAVITDFVKRIDREVKGGSGIMLSTAVFSSLTGSKESKKQNWQTWIKSGLIDIATPMAYFDAATDVLKGVSDMILLAGANCYYYTGLASSYRGMPAFENAYQIEASYLGGASGYVIFSSAQLLGHQDVADVLKSGFNSRDAVLPHSSASEVLAAYFNRVTERIDKIYIPAGGMTEAGKSALTAKFSEILAMDAETSSDLAAVRNAIASIYKTSNMPNYAKGFSARRIQETLTELASVIETKAIIAAETEDHGGDGGEIDSSSSESEEISVTPSKPEKPKKGCGSAMAGLPLTAILLPVALMRIKKKRE